MALIMRRPIRRQPCRVCKVSVLGTVTTVWGRPLVLGYSDPWGMSTGTPCPSNPDFGEICARIEDKGCGSRNRRL